MGSTPCCQLLPAPLFASRQQCALLHLCHLLGALTPGGTTRIPSWHGALRPHQRRTLPLAVSSTACSPCASVTLMWTRMARSTLRSSTVCARTLHLCLAVSVWRQVGRRSTAPWSAAPPPAKPCLTCLISVRAHP